MISEYLRFMANHMLSQKGLNGLFANPGFGKTTFLLHLIKAINEIDGKCLLFSLEMSEQQLLGRMDRLKINSNVVTVLDPSYCDPNSIADAVQKVKPLCVMIDYFQLIDGNKCEVLKGLKGVAEQFSVPVIFTGQLPRCSGDYDFSNHRPELYDLTYLFPADTPLHSARRALEKMDLIMFLHRHHNCSREIGAVHRYHISDNAELIIRQRYSSDLHSSYCFDCKELTEQRK